MSLQNITALAKADLADYEAQFSGLLSLPFGKQFVNFLKKHYLKGEVTAQLPGGYTCDDRLLVLTESYPNPQNPYRNGFVHRRVKAYEALGVKAQVFCMDFNADPGRYVIDGVQVTVGQRAELYAYLCTNPQIETVFVHFLNAAMWDVLKRFPARKYITFSHGYDIQPYYHRPFLYHTKAEHAFGKAQSVKREAFWNEIFTLAKEGQYDLQFVFVSEFLRNAVLKDYPLAGDVADKFAVIHNCIDRSVFYGREKTADQRFKLLSVKSYESAQYANDITAKAILLLSKEPFFEKLEFMIAGNGRYFDEITKPLRKFKNVTLHKGYFPQTQLAELYRSYGISLQPTRFDTQGVSRDEAMSCGMAVITTATAAVPEFADDSCAILTPYEDAAAVAEGVKQLYHDPERFLALSKAAIKRVEVLQPQVTAKKELVLAKILPKE